MLPELFKQRMEKMLDADEYQAFVDSFGDDSSRYHALRINALKADMPTIEGLGERVPWEESGFYYADYATPGKHPYHEAGLYYIQEPSAMAPVHYLDPGPGEKILDLCAAPGGKSTQIACRMNGQGILISNEINRDRAKILSLNVERLGITNCMVLNETPEHLSERFEGYFDKILVDAPCSGEGMFRKNESASVEWSPENVKACAERQSLILDCAAKMLLPGGTLVYSTCTFAPDENEESIFRFLLKHPDFHVQKTELFDGMQNARPEFISRVLLNNAMDGSVNRDDATTSENGDCSECISIQANEESPIIRAIDVDRIKSEVGDAIRLWPHKLKGEGHFLCVLKRDGELLADRKDNYVPGGRNIAAKKDVQKIFADFVQETLKPSDDVEKNTDNIANGDSRDNSCSRSFTKGREKLSVLDMPGTIFTFGDQLYLAPIDMPSTTGLKVMRPGLHLGIIKKDRFEPSHALALAMRSSDAKLTVDFSSDSSEIRQYLNGQTIRVSDTELSNAKGWTLITVDGYSIGWAKLAGGQLKNHYPKGLRINY